MGRRVNGYGPTPSAICLIGQRPGKVEAYRGRPFVGPSGQMLDDYLLAASIDRAACYTTNVVRTYDGDDDVTEAEIEADLPELKRELLQCRPKYIGLLGRVAVDVMLPSVPDRELYWMHGLMFGWQAPWGYCRLMPCYHPAAGMHQTNIQGATAWDFERFSAMVRGEKVAEYKDGTYTGDYTEGTRLPPWGTMAVDTEGSVRQPWCLSWSSKARTADVVRKPKPWTIDVAILHHSLHDLAVLKAMGITVTKFEDTLLKAALLGCEPMGLKDLARRHLGIKLRHYDDLVRAARREKAINYLGEVMEWIGLTTSTAGK